MKKILLQLDCDPFPSVFDVVTAYDAGVDVVLQYGNVTKDNVRDLVYGVMFTRGGEKLKSSAIFIGGSNVSKAEEILEVVKNTFFGNVRNSVMFDPSGCNTTAASAVAKMSKHVDIKGEKVVVLAGTGPVGQRAAALFALEGAQVVLTSRSMDRAKKAVDEIKRRFGFDITPAAAFDEDSTRRVLEGAVAALCTGAPGVTLIPEKIWKTNPTLKVLGDVNAVPPLGIECMKSSFDGENIEGKILFGSSGIGGLKMKVHRACVERLFERNDQVFDAEAIFDVAKELS
ncbi:NADP-dependent methylenetetrahydromethanopterin/methylenetetrahydrofolate dehydrogenase [Acetomicrobium sp.]|uniref:NADP-dependent methylenetetrahydromethanopterin/methylenetetrahydrofolate dehydrogenase n=1 Tax=Acetomicrobium sp. TaxID=1872099 RepID=UPI002871C020|nr:NADP-dependent methylenetetrahydromethanopterin/methylenetetrahydrofolate dehydrogenase [Acetomicrobium sp.]MDR9769712.1 NADP-dependent methylenetetrahydromethanopterin/methylenetetrahydrofolate dehydrogenase [Acetomicrobium sp.]HOM98018.1 NADP-dependent methylenetetrahydromethanopterin/methylenetetrahydrofolate dehydrogenase [Acetomicrobium sp.]